MIVPYPHKFFIIGRPRTGTTQLTGICNCHPDLKKSQYEPFLHQQWGRDVRSGKLLVTEALRGLYRENDGIKELLNLGPHNDCLRECVLRLPVQIIVTERRNKLRQAVSHCVATKLGIWQQRRQLIEGGNYLEKVESLGDLPLNLVNKYLKSTHEAEKRFKKELEVHNKKCYKIYYEDFYFGDSNYQERVLAEMFDFIGVKPIFTSRMRDLLDHGRLNNKEVYSCIQNVSEIDYKFSKYGYLLNRSFL